MSPRVRASAATFLPPEEALQTLYAAIAESPEDPYIHMQLTVETLEQQEAQPSPENDAAAIEAALNFAAAAPNNATAYLMEAAARVAAGDGTGALEALAAARQSSEASTYALEAANLRAQALAYGRGQWR